MAISQELQDFITELKKENLKNLTKKISTFHTTYSLSEIINTLDASIDKALITILSK